MDSSYQLTEKKKTRRGFVMTGGGAKGLYEAGVVQAFHLCNMTFDVITGSSIGAINSVAYAEYQFRKSELDRPEDAEEAQRTIQQMDRFIYALHSAWLEMPQVMFIDDSEEGPIGRIKEDFTKFDLTLPMLTRLAWWWTTPNRLKAPLPLADIVSLGRELVERLGGGIGEVVKNGIMKKGSLAKNVVDSYLKSLDIGVSLVDERAEKRLKEHFTKAHVVLTEEHLDGRLPDDYKECNETFIEQNRTFKEYYDKQIDLRLTRTNFRTGLFEISAYVPKKAFAQAVAGYWRVNNLPREGFPVTSFRLELPGNPRVIDAALAASRYPGVFSPLPLHRIYPEDDPENAFLYRLLDEGFASEEVKDKLVAEVDKESREDVEKALGWLGDERHLYFKERFFPCKKDRYLDGGTIDNTPSNTAIDGIKQRIRLGGGWRRNVSLDLYTVLLHRLPAQEEVEDKDTTLFDVVQRTLMINKAARLTTEAEYVDVVSYYGDRAEQLAEMVLVLLKALEKMDMELNPDPDQKKFPEMVRDAADSLLVDEPKRDPKRYKRYMQHLLNEKDEKYLSTLKGWSEDQLEKRLPLDIDVVQIHPDDMPLHTLAFTERLGYERQKGIDMITMGCYNTLWELLEHLEMKQQYKLDKQDCISRDLVRLWTGIPEGEFPKEDDYESQAAWQEALEEKRRSWACKRLECIFHRKHCAYGARKDPLFEVRN